MPTWTTEELKKLRTKADELGLDEVDDLIHDLFSAEASDVNNGGLDEQLEVLIGKWGYQATLEAIEKDAAE